MGRARKKADAAEGLVCAQCGEDCTDQLSRSAKYAYHCEGKSRAFNASWRGKPHHWISLHGNCPSCGADIGCGRCSGLYRDLLCTNCETWTNGDKPVPRAEGQRRLNVIYRDLVAAQARKAQSR